jgi:hypothetical protein
MGGVELLEQAKAVGLEVKVEGTRLILRGHRSTEALAKKLLDHKEQIIALLQPTHSNSNESSQWADLHAVRTEQDRWSVRWHKGFDYLEAMQARGESETPEFERLFAEWEKIDVEYKRLEDLYDELLVEKRKKGETMK